MAGNQRRRAEWEARLARWRTSRVSIRQFCFDERVSEPSFYQWRKRLQVGRAPPQRQAHEDRRASAASAPRFLPIEVVGGAASADNTVIEIRLASGVALRVPTDVDEARLRALVRLLRDEDARC